MWVLVGRTPENFDKGPTCFADPMGQTTEEKRKAALFHTEGEAEEFRDRYVLLRFFVPRKQSEC